jgi:hypothetical protein
VLRQEAGGRRGRGLPCDGGPVGIEADDVGVMRRQMRAQRSAGVTLVSAQNVEPADRTLRIGNRAGLSTSTRRSNGSSWWL